MSKVIKPKYAVLALAVVALVLWWSGAAGQTIWTVLLVGSMVVMHLGGHGHGHGAHGGHHGGTRPEDADRTEAEHAGTERDGR